MAEKKEVRDDDEKSAPDAKGATEADLVKIDTIKGSETLGYKGEAKEEHSGQTGGRSVPDPEGDVADQNPKIPHSSH